MAIQAQRKSSEGSPTRTRVLQVAATLFADRGYSAVGVNEIGEATGLGRGALYYHISSKEDLLYDITTAYMSELVAEADAILARETGGVARVRLLSRALMGVLPNVCRDDGLLPRVAALTAERRLAVMGLHHDSGCLGKCISDGVAEGVFQKIPVVVLKGLLGMYFYSFLWLDPKGSSSAEQIGDAFAEVVLRSLIPGAFSLA